MGEKGRKKFQSRIPLILDPGKKIPKKKSKKIQKIKTHLSGIIFSQNGMRQTEKEKKKICPEFRLYQARARKFLKKQKKKLKNQKNFFPELFLAKTGGDRPKKKEKKKFQSRIPFILGLGMKILKKIAKKLKKLKNPFPALFLANMG